MKFNIANPDLLPGNGWLYRLYFQDELVYIGMTVQKHPLMRIAMHFKDKEFDVYEIEQYPMQDLPEIEMSEIKKHRPKFNIVGVGRSGRLQWIAANIPTPTNRQFKKLDAVNYCVSTLKQNGCLITAKQRESIYNNLNKWVWYEGKVFLENDLNELILEIISGRHKTIIPQKLKHN